MLEEQETPLPVEGNEIRLTIRPFEIRTLRRCGSTESGSHLALEPIGK
ncbi:MAG: glycosyl hydrolase-related protein [Lachnospiraceae bacterium]